MDLREVKSVVSGEFWEWERDHLDDKDCPKCKASCTMVSVSVMPLGSEVRYTHKWRCLNCLGLFTEELKEIEN